MGKYYLGETLISEGVGVCVWCVCVRRFRCVGVCILGDHVQCISSVGHIEMVWNHGNETAF